MPVITKHLADQITEVAREQWRVSGLFKQPRMEKIKENEDYALGIVKPDLDIPFNDCYPVMSGYVSDMMGKIDDAPSLSFGSHGKSDFLLAEKIGSAFERTLKSKEPNDMWRLKDRWWKKNAIYSGRGIAKFWSSTPNGLFQSNLKIISHYDFHCEPDGGGHLENHLFMGEEAIFKTKEELLIGAKNGIYDPEQVGKLINNYNDDDYKDNFEDYENRSNRSRALNLDVRSNNYVGQALFKFVEWYLTYKGTRWYCLFEETTYTWIRVKPLVELFATNKFPYVSWSTDEDPNVFWNLAPCDPVRVLAKATNRFLNQETYNREKQNKGQKAYDAEMFLDIDALDDPAVDSLIPAKVPKGKSIAGGLYEFTVPGLGGTINMVNFLDQFISKKAGGGPGAVSDQEKRVGIFYGELEQANQFIGTKNKSYTEAQEELGMKFAEGLYENLDHRGMEIKLMGPSGVEWTRLTRYELRKREKLSLDIKVDGGTDQEELNEVERKKKNEALSRTASVNPQWRDREILKQAGYTDEEIKEAFSQDTAGSKKLIAQAYEAIEEIEMGRTPRINRDANATFMQTIINFAKENDISDKLFEKLMQYAMDHVEIASRNTAREARQAINDLNAQSQVINQPNIQPGGQGGQNNNNPGPSLAGISNSIGANASNQLRQLKKI